MWRRNARAGKNARGESRRGLRPQIEGLESRDLMTTIAPNLPGKHYPALSPAVQQFAAILYPPGTPQPTAAELQRESFVAKVSGRYTIGPGHFADQTITIHGFGKPGTSNVSQRFHFQFLIFEPTDPSKTVTGAINFTGGNYLQNGSNLILDLQGPTGTEVNGLPTHLYWSHDAASGTAFAGVGAGLTIAGNNVYSNFPTNYFNGDGVPESPLAQGLAPTSVNNWNVGMGDVTLHFTPDKHPVAGSDGSGTVTLVFHGLLNYSGAQSAADQQYN
jgi:hypothetical protein